VSRAEELEVLRHKYAAVSDPRAKAAIAEYADELYGRGWREEPPAEGPSSVQGPGRVRGTGRILLAFLDGRLELFDADVGLPVERRPEHVRLLRHIDELNPTLRRIA
jgi:hypothetical protein